MSFTARMTNFLEENRQQIFYLVLFYSANFFLFFERFIRNNNWTMNEVNYLVITIDYSYMSEHSDLRHIMGIGIAVTRGCASALSFNFSLLLITMSR